VALHQLTSFTLGVPDPEETAVYYREFGPGLDPETF
jgi:hypothetical protein